MNRLPDMNCRFAQMSEQSFTEQTEEDIKTNQEQPQNWQALFGTRAKRKQNNVIEQEQYLYKQEEVGYEWNKEQRIPQLLHDIPVKEDTWSKLDLSLAQSIESSRWSSLMSKRSIVSNAPPQKPSRNLLDRIKLRHASSTEASDDMNFLEAQRRKDIETQLKRLFRPINMQKRIPQQSTTVWPGLNRVNSFVETTKTDGKKQINQYVFEYIIGKHTFGPLHMWRDQERFQNVTILVAKKSTIQKWAISESQTALESIESEIGRLSKSQVPTHMLEVIETPSKLYLIAEYNKEYLDSLGIKTDNL